MSGGCRSRSIARSIALTNKRGWLCFALVALTALPAVVLLQFVGAIDQMLGPDPGMAARVMIALASGAVSALFPVAYLLVQVAAYRRLAAPSSGI